MKRFVLLEDIPGVYWTVGLLVPIIFGVVSYLINLNVSRQNKEIDSIKEDIDDLKEKDRATNDKINDVNLKILNDINGIMVKLAELKRDLS